MSWAKRRGVFPMMLKAVSLLIILLGTFSPAPVQAQDPTPGARVISDDEINEVARELYCPVCENIPLDTCGTEACEQWRSVIRDKLEAGWSKGEIKNYFVNQYGDRVLSEPPRQGFNWLVYIVPPVVFFAGVYLLYRGFRTWQSLDEDPVPEEDPLEKEESDEEYLSRVEEELQKRQ